MLALLARWGPLDIPKTQTYNLKHQISDLMKDDPVVIVAPMIAGQGRTHWVLLRWNWLSEGMLSFVRRGFEMKEDITVATSF